MNNFPSGPSVDGRHPFSDSRLEKYTGAAIPRQWAAYYRFCPRKASRLLERGEFGFIRKAVYIAPDSGNRPAKTLERIGIQLVLDQLEVPAAAPTRGNGSQDD